MIPNNNLSVLPFYTDLDKQNHRKDYAFGEIFPLFAPDKKIPAFQIIRPHRSSSVTHVGLVNMNTGVTKGILPELSGLSINNYPTLDYDVIIYPGLFQIDSDTPEGQYYLILQDSKQAWFSEVFTVVRSVDQYLKISYRDSESLHLGFGQVDFPPGFRYTLYLPTQVGRPEYEFEEQVENRDGFTFVEKQISEKTYKFNFLAPEYLLDAMRIIRMVDDVEILNKGDKYSVDQFLMTPKWQDGGLLAAVEVEFQCDTVIKKIGRGFTQTPIQQKDFNIDFNNDFNK